MGGDEARAGQNRTEPNPALEPLLWLQLLGLGAMAGEALALLVLLGSVDPGPFPGLERLLIWALGALAPAVVLSKRPADPWSLLLLQAPIRGRRDLQRRLLRLQDQPLLRLSPLLAAALLLPAIWRIDQAGGLATGLSPLADSNRLVVLLLSLPLLALIVWQWQQIGQALWLLTRPASAIQAAEPLSQTEQQQERLSLGLPLLLLGPLQTESAPQPPPPATEVGTSTLAHQAKATAAGSTDPAPADHATPPQASEPGASPSAPDDPAEATTIASAKDLSEPSEAPDPSEALAAGDEEPIAAADSPTPSQPSGSHGSESQECAEDDPGDGEQTSGSGSIEPEQAAGDGQGGDLDQEVAGLES